MRSEEDRKRIIFPTLWKSWLKVNVCMRVGGVCAKQRQPVSSVKLHTGI